MKKTKIRAAVVGLSAALLLSACGGATSSNGSSSNSGSNSIPTSIDLVDGFDPDAHFRWATIQLVAGWDPVDSIGGGDLPIYLPVYDRLLDLDQTAQLMPMLATDWEVAEDNKSVVLTLREGLTFSDGTVFDAEAVKFNLERNAAEGSGLANESAAFESAEVIDANTIKINVSGGLGAYMTALAVRSGVMVSPTAAQSGALDEGPVGIGPYTMTNFVPGDRVEYERTDDYWDPEAQNVATMTYRLMVDDQTRYNALASGELDGIFLQPGQIDAAVDAGMNVVSSPATNFLYIAVNAESGPFQNPDARLALHYSLNRAEIAQGLFDGHCTPSVQPFPPTSIGYSDEIGDGADLFPYDPDQAKSLLADAGVDEGTEVQLMAPNPTMFVQLAEVVQSQLGEVGIEASVKPVPAAELVQVFSIDQSAEAAVLPYVGTPDPDGVMSYFKPGHPYNIGDAASQETIDLGAAASDPVDVDERKELYADVAQSLIDNPTQIIPICHLHVASAYAENVSNVEQPSYGAPTQRGVALSKN